MPNPSCIVIYFHTFSSFLYYHTNIIIKLFTASCCGLQVKMMFFEIIYYVSLQAGKESLKQKIILDQPTGGFDAQGVEIHPLLK